MYQYTWNPKVWGEYYATGPEILQYFKSTVEEYCLSDLIRLRHRVDKAEWNDNEGRWRLSITDLESKEQFEDECDIFVNAMGFLK